VLFDRSTPAYDIIADIKDTAIMKSIISIVKSEYNDVYRNLERALALVSPLGFSGSKTVIIKINLCDARTADTGAITHPLFLDAVLHYLREHFESLKIYVVESDATVVLADEFIKWFGFIPILEKWNAEFINLSKIGVVNKKIDGRYFKEVPVPEVFERSDYFITTSKPKTNPIATITCCLKNQFGCLPMVEKDVYHPYLADVIADVNKAICPDLCLVDGIIAMGGSHGPAFGVPIPLKAIICSKDPVATDAFCAKLMGFNPWFIGHIRKSASSGLGSMKYTLKGDTIGKVNFETNKLEMWLIHLVGGSRLRHAQKQFRAQGRKT
jgi:uncharacterized protein (DUF362 family)